MWKRQKYKRQDREQEIRGMLAGSPPLVPGGVSANGQRLYVLASAEELEALREKQEEECSSDGIRRSIECGEQQKLDVAIHVLPTDDDDPWFLVEVWCGEGWAITGRGLLVDEWDGGIVVARFRSQEDASVYADRLSSLFITEGHAVP